MATIATVLTILLLALAVACQSMPAEPASTPTPTAAMPSSPLPAETPPLATLRLEPLPTDREFRAPTNLVQAQNGRLLVTEQDGPDLDA